jgi:ABC-type lipoprotein export system ATPase subunit
MVTHDPRYARHSQRAIHLFDGQIAEERRNAEADKELLESGFEIHH